jgi:hypothetical protein
MTAVIAQPLSSLVEVIRLPLHSVAIPQLGPVSVHALSCHFQRSERLSFGLSGGPSDVSGVQPVDVIVRPRRLFEVQSRIARVRSPAFGHGPRGRGGRRIATAVFCIPRESARSGRAIGRYASVRARRR